MTKKKIQSTIISLLLLCTSICSVFAADTAVNIGTATEPASVGYMERISGPIDFDFEIVSVGNDSVVAEFTSSGRITNPPYVGEKGTKNIAEKVSNLQYVLEYDKEYSFVYSVTKDDIETVYNSFLTVERGSDIRVVFDDIIKNEISDEFTRATGTKTEQEPNNSYNEATRTFNDYDNYGFLSYNKDVDWWAVSFRNSGTANFWLGNIPENCDYDIDLYASDGTTLLMSSGNYGNTQELLRCPVEAVETYYIKIYSCGGTSNSQYLFRAKCYPTVVTPSITINFLSNVPSGTKVYIYRENDTGATDMKVPDGVPVSGNSISIQNYSATWEGELETNNITIGKSYAINIVAPGKAVKVIHPFTIPSSGNYSINVALLNRNIIFSSPFTSYTSPSIMSCQNYGYRYDNSVPAQREFHTGIDITKPEGTPINSICDVSLDEYSTGEDDSRGKYVEVDYNASQFKITYMHLSSFVDFPTSGIAQSQTIGYVGNTGNSTGAHLHIQIENSDGEYIDPQCCFD